MKVRHFNTVFRALLLFLVAFCSFVAFSDGTCQLMQNSDGTFRIICEGGTIIYTEEVKTNNVYIIENCESLKSDLVSLVDNIAGFYTSSINYLDEIADTSSDILSGLNSDNDPDYVIYDGVFDIRDKSYLIRDNLTDARNRLIIDNDSLRSQINNIECGSCSTNSSGSSCCDVDLTPILQQMNDAQLLRLSFTNYFSQIVSILGSYVGGNTNYRFWRDSLAVSTGKESISQFLQSTAYNDRQRNILNVLVLLQDNLANTQASINNYLYRVTHFQIPNISNNLEVVKNTTSNLYIASTNHFSFFRHEVFVRPALEDWTPNQGSYYDYLTNYYIRVVNRDSSLSSTSKTNWFSRIETLLASLVFADSESTNTVDESYGHQAQRDILNSLDGISDTSSSQVHLMSSMGDSLLSSLRSLNSSFSSAVSLPSEVELVSISDSVSNSRDSVSFQTSEMGALVEACHCATTLAWCFGGIWLLFVFVSWSVKTSYGLVVFCWSVVTSIFSGGGK